MKKFMVPIFLLAITAADAGPLPLFRFAVTDVTVIDLGNFGGDESVAYDINNAGQVVGGSRMASGTMLSFLYDRGDLVDLFPSLRVHNNVATGINNSGSVIGNVFIAEAESYVSYRGRIESDTPEILGRDYDTEEREFLAGTWVNAISDSDLIVGNWYLPGGPAYVHEATIWEKNSASRLSFGHIPGSPSNVSDVNADGLAVGFDKFLDTPVMWTWTPKGITTRVVPYPPLGPGAHPYPYANARGINKLGMVVGFYEFDSSTSSNKEHAFLWNGYGLESIDLGLLPDGSMSVADDINDEGFVAGFADRVLKGPPFGGTSLQSGFLFHGDFGMFKLPRPAFTRWDGHCRAKALNERNESSGIIQVVGTCDTEEGSKAVMWEVKVSLELIAPVSFGK